MPRWVHFAFAYASLAVASGAIGLVWLNHSPFVHPEPWLLFAGSDNHVYSAALGLAFGALVVVATRLLVTRVSWARRLHCELRPLTSGIPTAGIVVLAVLSALGEELLFRGLIAPWLGLIPQALIFGLAHQIRGASRWVWAGWATAVGLALGAVFQLSGSLLGPLLAHALINGLNLHFLKSHDPDVGRRGLGGLLGQRG